MFTLEIEDSSKLWLTSDPHFNHYNICQFCNRPFKSSYEMNNTLIKNWNDRVGEDDIVVCCGDFMLNHGIDKGKYKRLSERLNGKIYLVKGNHDKIDLTFEILRHIEAIVDQIILRVDGKTTICTHFPLLAFPYDYNAFGHIHTLSDGLCHGKDSYVNGMINKKRQYDVGVDQNGYAPISYKEFIYKLNR